MDLFVYVFICLGLFIAGQFYGERRMKKKAMMQMQMMHSGMSSYHDSIKAVLKEQGIDLDTIDKLAMERHLKESIEKITETIKVAREGAPVDDDEENGQGK